MVAVNEKCIKILTKWGVFISAQIFILLTYKCHNGRIIIECDIYKTFFF